jgi:hypothetical protein
MALSSFYPSGGVLRFSAAEVKQGRSASRSSSYTGASSAYLQQQRVEDVYGFVEIDKSDGGIAAFSISSSSFNILKELARVTGFTYYAL